MLIISENLGITCDCSGELQTLLALQGANIISTKELVRNDDSLLHEVVAEFKPQNSNPII
ncbi:TPA: hypothetical protein DEP90_02100 [Patescibacteria group bacterium]|nr:hypothetical protein [Patescibacteria group bacterium]